MRKYPPLEVGRIVRSMAGRDAGRRFVVLGLEGDTYALLADGEGRKVRKPKKKKRIHLRTTQLLSTQLQQKLIAGDAVYDYELRAALKEPEPHEEG